MEQLSEGSAQAVADPPAANRPAQDNRTPFGLIFYLVASLLSLFMLLAVIAPDKTPFVKDQVFPGLAQAERPLRELFSRGLIWAWVAVGLGVVLLSLIALAIVKATAKPQDAPTPGTAFSWRKIYSIRLRLTDFMVITWAVCGAQMVWFGLPLSINAGIGDSSRVSQQWLSLVIIVGWMVALDLMGAWRSLFYGEGTTEYGRVFMASFAWAGAVAIIATLVKLTMSRGYLLLAFPLGLLGLLASHKLWRIWLVVKRTRQTLYTQRAVVVAGSSQGAERVLAEFQRSPTAGYTALAVALPTGAEPSPALLQKGLKLVDAADAVSAMRSSMADSLVVADSALLGVGLVQRFGWSLDPKNEYLVLVPELLDIAGPRIATRPVAGINLLHVELPTFSGPAAAFKRLIDVLVSAAGLIILAAPFAVLAVIIKATSKGPVFYKQNRIGLGGEEFTIWKFRSMISNADQHFDELRPAADAGNTVQFKMKEDPRITPIGRFIRRWSIDELPQLFNVFIGSMSLVGPRPHAQYEVDQYTPWEKERRFLVKPGMTGLWQVSGRSDLSWEDSIRLDLYYVQNWSILVDIQLLFRTLRAVVRSDGAY